MSKAKRSKKDNGEASLPLRLGLIVDPDAIVNDGKVEGKFSGTLEWRRLRVTNDESYVQKGSRTYVSTNRKLSEDGCLVPIDMVLFMMRFPKGTILKVTEKVMDKDELLLIKFHIEGDVPDFCRCQKESMVMYKKLVQEAKEEQVRRREGGPAGASRSAGSPF